MSRDLVDNDDLVELTFRIGDVFPSSDPVARYVTGVAMIANDWGRLFRLQEAVGDQEAGVRLLLYRLQLSFHMEAVKFLRQSRQQYPREIERFLENLSEEAIEIHRELFAFDGFRVAEHYHEGFRSVDAE